MCPQAYGAAPLQFSCSVCSGRENFPVIQWTRWVTWEIWEMSYVRTSFRVLSIMPNIPVISVGSQMERSVSVWSDRNTRDHPASGGGPATLTGRTEICRSILTNRFVARHLFSRFQISRKEWKIVRAIPLSWSGSIEKCRYIIPRVFPLPSDRSVWHNRKHR